LTEGKSLSGQRVTSVAGNLRLGWAISVVIRARGTAQPGAVILDATIGTPTDTVGLLPRVAGCSAA
jgi:hypothetical protein